MLGWLVSSGPNSLTYGFSHRRGAYEICVGQEGAEQLAFYALFGDERMAFVPPQEGVLVNTTAGDREL